MGELRDIKVQKPVFARCALGVGAIAVLVVVCCCYFFIVQRYGKSDEQSAGEIYILKDEVVETS